MVKKSTRLKEIGQQVRYWRKEVRGLTLKEVAEEIGSAHTAVAKLEAGKAGMSLERLERLAAALNAPVGVLLDPTIQQQIDALKRENWELRQAFSQWLMREGANAPDLVKRGAAP